jgi:hypothetical protein
MRTAFITLSGTGRLIAVDWPRPGLPLHEPAHRARTGEKALNGRGRASPTSAGEKYRQLWPAWYIEGRSCLQKSAFFL